VPIINVLNVGPNETITAAVPVPDFKQANFCTMATRNGKIKRVTLEKFEAVRPSGLIAMGLADDDSLGWVRLTSGKNEIILVTELGKALRYAEDNVRAMGRPAAGVKSINMAEGDYVTSMEIVEKGGDLLVIGENGIGKRTPLDDYPAKGRATGGVLTTDAKMLDKVGRIAAARVVQEEDEVTIISTGGKIIRTTVKEIKQAGRATMGVILMNLGEGDSVATLARIAAADLKRVGLAQDNGDDPDKPGAAQPRAETPDGAKPSADGKAVAKAKKAAAPKAKKSSPAEKTAKTKKPAKKAPSTRRKLKGFDLPERTVELLEGGGISTVSQFLKRLAKGDDAILSIKGIGPKALEGVKKLLKREGYKLP
jgi:hypothetical protein